MTQAVEIFVNTFSFCSQLSSSFVMHVFVAQDTQNPSCLKQFLDHHGLSLLWIFMVELSEAKGNSSNNIKLQLEVTYVIEFDLQHSKYCHMLTLPSVV